MTSVTYTMYFYRLISPESLVESMHILYCVGISGFSSFMLPFLALRCLSLLVLTELLVCVSVGSDNTVLSLPMPELEYPLKYEVSEGLSPGSKSKILKFTVSTLIIAQFM